MGKLHRIKRQIMRSPEKYVGLGVQDNTYHPRFTPGKTKAYRNYVRAVLGELLYNNNEGKS